MENIHVQESHTGVKLAKRVQQRHTVTSFQFFKTLSGNLYFFCFKPTVRSAKG